VYLAEQPVLGRLVAVKVLHLSAEGAPTLEARFLREARLASQVDHPFAAHVYSFGVESDGLLWLAMEYVRGEPLSEWIQERGPLPLADFVGCFEKLCEVVHALHQKGLVHSDLKPANVMVTARNGKLFPKLLDLGLATRPESVTAPGAAPGNRVLGSPRYVAPERWKDPSTVSPRADLYSLAVMAFECLTGRPPFEAEDPVELAHAHLKDPPPPLGEAFPASVGLALGRGLAKSPELRYPDAPSLAYALRIAAGGSEAGEVLPQLPVELRETALRELPQPLAEAVAALEAAHSPKQLSRALAQLRRTAVRWLGLLAMAARARLGSASFSLRASTLISELRAEGLSDKEWVELGAELCEPFVSLRDAFPVPELLEVFVDPSGRRRIGAWMRDALFGLHEAEASTTRVTAAVEAAEALLGELLGLRSYGLVRSCEGRDERWTGLRRAERPVVVNRRGLHLPGAFLLVDREGEAALTLSPLVQAISPAPGGAEEAFFLEGPGRYGAKLIAWPQAFERHDEELWPWVSRHVSSFAEPTKGREVLGESPYPGLSAFTRAQAQMFFGREREAESFANRLRAQHFLTLVGPSGAGKSSFLQAGVVPLLPDDWRAVTVRPGPHPLASLVEGVKALGRNEEGLQERLRQSPAALGEALAAFARERGGAVVFIVDQFEELLTLCPDPAQRARCAESLTRAAAHPEGQVRVVLALRDDFLLRVQALPTFRETLARGIELLSSPAPEDLVRIVAEPARRAGFSFDPPQLPQRMVDGVRDEPSALALLAFAASRLWELRDTERGWLTQKAYSALGGVGGALAHHAESVLTGLSPQGQALVREAFRHLVTAEGTRALLTRRQMLELLGEGALAQETLEALIQARLLVASQGPDGEDRLEVVHEALLGSWPRLVKWQKEDAENLRMRDQLRLAARQWEQVAWNKGALWRGPMLQEYQVWRRRYVGALTRGEEAFAQACLAEEARGRRLRRGLLALAFVVLAGAAAILAKSNATAHQRLLELLAEQGRQALLAEKPMQALAYLGEAYRQGERSVAARFMMARAADQLRGGRLVLGGFSQGVPLAEWSPDEKHVLAASREGSARLFDSGDGHVEAAFKFSQGPVSHAYFLGAGGEVGLSSREGYAVEIFSARTGQRLRTLGRDGELLQSSTASPDGKLVVTGARNGRIRVWDAATGSALGELAGHNAPVDLLRVSRDGSLLLTGDRSGVGRLWELPSGKPTFALTGHTDVVWRGDISPDGSLVVTGSDDRTVRVWSARTGRELLRFAQHDGHISDVHFIEGGRSVLTASEDGTARWVDVASGTVRRTFVTSGILRAAAMSADGVRIAVAGTDGVVRLFDAVDGHLVWQLVGHVNEVGRLSFNRDGTLLLTASEDTTARVWNAKQGGELSTFAVKEPLFGTTSGPSGNAAYSLGQDYVHAWEVASGNELWTWRRPSPNEADTQGTLGLLPDGQRFLVANGNEVQVRTLPDYGRSAILQGHQGKVTVVLVSPDGAHVATGSADRTVKLWDARTWKLLFTWPHTSVVWRGAFSPDGATVATTTQDGSVELWDVQSGRHLKRMIGHVGNVLGARFSADGRFLVSAGDDETLRVWNVASGEQVVRLQGQDSFEDAAFSPDGSLIFSGDQGGAVRGWDVHTGKLLGTVGTHRGLVWQVLPMPQEELISTADDGTAKRWRYSPVAATEVDELVRCATPFRLEGAQVVADAQWPRCGATWAWK
jgi:WD40 repeat protein